MKTSIICFVATLGLAIAANYGSNFNYGNNYPYTGSYIGAGSSYTGSTGHNAYSNYIGGSHAPNHVIVPHPYPLPVPVSSQTTTRLISLDNSNTGLFGFGGNNIFGFIVTLLIFQYILRNFVQNQG